MRLRLLGVVVACVLVALLVGVLMTRDSDDRGPAAEPVAADVTLGEEEAEEEGEEAEEEGGERGGAAEVEEEAEETEKRLEELEQAKAAGRFGAQIAATTTPATGWVGSRVMNSATDDWEPAVATDPAAPYVYMITTRYGTRECGSHCPTPFIAMTISS